MPQLPCRSAACKRRQSPTLLSFGEAWNKTSWLLSSSTKQSTRRAGSKTSRAGRDQTENDTCMKAVKTETQMQQGEAPNC